MSAGSSLNPACLNSSLASTVRCPSADRPSAMLNENIAAGLVQFPRRRAEKISGYSPHRQNPSGFRLAVGIEGAGSFENVEAFVSAAVAVGSGSKPRRHEVLDQREPIAGLRAHGRGQRSRGKVRHLRGLGSFTASMRVLPSSATQMAARPSSRLVDRGRAIA